MKEALFYKFLILGIGHVIEDSFNQNKKARFSTCVRIKIFPMSINFH